MNQAFYLYQLQKDDSQIFTIVHRITEIDTAIEKDTRISESEKMIQIAKKELERTHKILRELEEIGKSFRLEIETCEASLYSGKIRNPKELNDLQLKVSSEKKRLEKNEEEQLEQLMIIEEKELESKKLAQKLTEVQSLVATEHAKLRGEKSQLIIQKDTLETERAAKLSSVSEESLSIYNRLIAKKNGIAVALVEDRSCRLCGAPLTPAEWQAARSTKDLSFCSTCGRILYAN